MKKILPIEIYYFIISVLYPDSILIHVKKIVIIFNKYYNVSYNKLTKL